jgi:hypothetical protein
VHLSSDGTGGPVIGKFPGYAINLETGERLNIAFGEASELIFLQRGRYGLESYQ